MRKKCMNVTQTQPAQRKGQGVAIISKHNWQQAPLLQELCNDCTTVSLCTNSNKEGMQRVIVIGHYSKQGEQPEQDEKLCFLIKNLHQGYKNTELFLGGDFNRSRKEMSVLAKRLNLNLLEQEIEAATRVQGEQRSEIDFILTKHRIVET